MRVLGISAFYHDSAAALVDQGIIVAAAQEERFTRIKHDQSFPQEAITYCLQEAGIGLAEVDKVVFYDKPFTKFERLLETYLQFAPKGFSSFQQSMPLWIKEKLFQKSNLTKALKCFDPDFSHQNLLFTEHHLAHAASAFYPSPFNEALVLTMDGVGEWTTTSAAIGAGNTLNIIREIQFPHSLGLLYSAFTYYTGFKVNSGEYKVMGLAPYGKPIYAALIREHLIDIKPDGSFRLNLDYFDYCTGLRMTNEKFHALFGGPPRKSESPVTQKEMDLAASVQVVLEEVVLRLAESLRKETGLVNLCLAGGVALNCVANGRLASAGYFEHIYVQPAAGDAGGALGAALYGYYQGRDATRAEKNPIRMTGQDQMQGAYLGPAFLQNEIEQRLKKIGAVFKVLDDEVLLEEVAVNLQDEKVIGWFQGRMEFGPRALGNRSIIADPRSAKMQTQLNLKIKYRESFRPFAPAVLAEDVNDWFEQEVPSPYMLMVSKVRPEHQLPLTALQETLFGVDKLKLPRSTIPAVTHVDFSARIQTVHEDTNPRFHALISAFKEKTDCSVLVNTSFNVRGEPIVCTPEDAFQCFMGTEMDILVVGNCYLEKCQQDNHLIKDYKEVFALD